MAVDAVSRLPKIEWRKISWLFRWISVDYGKKIVANSKKVVTILSVPDDVIIKIFSFLSVDDIVNCLAVYGRWTALVQPLRFHQLQIKSEPKIIFVQAFTRYKFGELYLLSQNMAKKKLVTKKVSLLGVPKHYDPLELKSPKLICSCNGLLAFGECGSGFDHIARETTVTICNPVVQEITRIKIPVNRGCFLCGFYFHRPTRNYKLLFFTKTYQAIDEVYYCCNIDGSCWKEIRDFEYVPLHRCNYVIGIPVVVDKYLYWIGMVRTTRNSDTDQTPCSKAIIRFCTETEKFEALSHSPPYCTGHIYLQNHKYIQLVPMEENQLACCNLHEDKIEICKLVDSKNWIWGMRYVVLIEGYLKHNVEYSLWHLSEYLKLVSINNGQLLMAWEGRGLFQCDLLSNSVKRFKFPPPKEEGIWLLTSYRKSFVSLNSTV